MEFIGTSDDLRSQRLASPHPGTRRTFNPTSPRSHGNRQDYAYDRIYDGLQQIEGVELPEDWRGVWRPRGDQWVPWTGISPTDARNELAKKQAEATPQELRKSWESHAKHFGNLENLISRIYWRNTTVFPCLQGAMTHMSYSMVRNDQERDVLGALRTIVAGTVKIIEEMEEEDVEAINHMLNPEDSEQEAQEEGLDDEDDDNGSLDSTNDFMLSSVPELEMHHTQRKGPCTCYHTKRVPQEIDETSREQSKANNRSRQAARSGCYAPVFGCRHKSSPAAFKDF